MPKFDITLVRGTVDNSHLGKTAFFPLAVNGGKLLDVPEGVECNAEIKQISEKRQRSHEQLSLYWVGCRFIADISDDVSFDSSDKVDEQCKIHARHYRGWIHYHNQKTGEMSLNIMTRSVSYAELGHLEACGYFDKAFKFQTEIYNLKYGTTLTTEEYSEVLKEYIKNDYNAARGLA